MSKTVHRKASVIAGRYSFDREIGRGGMGAVWLGRDEMLGRQVALKQIGLLPGADGTDLARAEREARLAAQPTTRTSSRCSTWSSTRTPATTGW